MTSPVEKRLREALAEAGATVRPETIAPLSPLAGARRVRMDVRWLAAVATVVVVGATAVGVAGLTGSGQRGGERQVAAAVAVPRDQYDVAVYLCRSVRPQDGCHGRGVTAEQKAAAEIALRDMREVAEVHVQERGQAYKSLLAEYPELAKEIGPEGVPEGFRLLLHAGSDIRPVLEGAKSLPGVADVVDLRTDGKHSPPRPERDRELAVFLCVKGGETEACRSRADGATLEDKRAVQQAIEALPEATSVRFEDQEAAYENFKETYANQPALVRATKVEDMPESFRIRLPSDLDSERRAEIRSELREMAGVAQVADFRCRTESFVLRVYHGILAKEVDKC